MAVSKTKVAVVSALVLLALLVPALFVAGDAGFLDGLGPIIGGLRSAILGDGAALSVAIGRAAESSSVFEDDVEPGNEGGDGATGAGGVGGVGWEQVRFAGELQDEPADIAHPARPARTPVSSVQAAQGEASEAEPQLRWVPPHQATDGVPLSSGLVEDDSVNVLILGLDREAFLLDTMGIVSISEKAKAVKVIMIPRDTYIAYSSPVLADISKIGHAKLPGEYKANNIYNVAKNTTKVSDAYYNDNRFEERGFDFLAQVIYEKFGVWVDDFVRINTYGFVKLVDMFGGVRVTVPMRMRYVDPDQKLNINLQKGTYVLNGAQAEGFVRFRQGYGASGKITVYADRTANQIAFLKAFYEQHGKLSNIGKIPDLLSLLKKNVVHSVSVEDIFTKYVDVLTAVVQDGYEFESYEFETKDKKISGSNYLTIIN